MYNWEYKGQRCINCSGPLTGGGIGYMCETCRKIEAIEKQTEAIKAASRSGPGTGGGEEGIVFKIVGWAIFLFICSLGNWLLPRIFWYMLCFFGEFFYEIFSWIF